MTTQNKNGQDEIKLYMVRESKDHATAFFAKYSISKFGASNKKGGELKPRKDRICRFCGSSYPDTTFKNAAHSIPHFLGNRYLLNDFECDQCNDIFSKYETSLGDYLLLKRIFNGTKGKKGTPKKESSDKTESISFNNGIISVSGKNLLPSELGVKHESKTTYNPIHIYKTLVKIALSVLDDSDVKYYKDFIQRYLLSSTHDNDLLPIAKIGCYSVDRMNKVDEVRYLLFQKKSDCNNPHHLFSLYYADHIFTYPIPLHLNDFVKGYYANMDIPMPPPLLFSRRSSSSKVKFERLDFGFTKNVRKVEEVEFIVDREKLKNHIEKKMAISLPENFKLDGLDFRPNL